MRPNLPALTSVRFLAALYVLMVHFGRHAFPRQLADFAYLGSSGVSMFFVLSGFILTYTYAGRPMKAGRFYWARFARIWPVYLLLLALSLEVYWPRLQAVLQDFSPWEVALRFATGTQAWTLSGEAMALTGAVNNPSWSISTEVGFYLLFPLLLAVAWRLPLRTLLWGAAAVWAALTLPAWLLGYGVTLPIAETVVYKSPVFRLADFVVGIAAGVLFLKRPELARTPRLGWWAWGFAIFLLVYGMDAGLPRRALISGGLAPAFALVVFTLAGRRGPARLLEWRPLVFLGEASYAFYLAHYPVALYTQEAGLRIGTNAHLAATTAITLGVAAVVYVAVERPARTWLRGLLRGRPAPVTVAREA